MKEFLQIIHISDIHFSKKNKANPVFNSVKLVIPDLKPDIIVVTGDIADNVKPEINPYDFEISLLMALKFLLEICKDCSLNPNERLFVVPGNHDYRYAGNLPRSKYPDLFKEIFGTYFRTRYVRVDNLGFIVCCFDSNSENHEINFSEGLILKEEFNRLKEDFSKLRHYLGQSTFDQAHRIGLLHHHPMPIFRSEYKTSILDSFLNLRNSATFISEAIRYKIRVILHGHKHHRGFSKASFPSEQRRNDYVACVAAGSIGKATEENEFSFNIVKYYHDGRVYIHHLVQRGQSNFYYEQNEKEPYIIIDREDARKFRYESLIDSETFVVERLLCIDEIDPFSGDWKLYHHAKGLTTNSPLTQTIPQSIQSSGGLYTKKPEYEILFPIGQTAIWEDIGEVKNGIKKGNIRFDFQLSQSPVIYSITEEVINAISFTKEERKAALCSVIFEEPDSDRKEDEERLFLRFESQYPKKLGWEIRFPNRFFPENPRIRVYDESGHRDFVEQVYCENNFHYSNKNNAAVLNIDYPIRYYKYAVIWNLKEEMELLDNELTDLQKLNIKKIKQYFLKSSKESPDDWTICSWLKSIHNDLICLKELGFKEKHADLPIEMSISIFDDEMQALRYAAFYCPKCDDLKNASIWKYSTRIGHPISGWVYKRKQFHITLTESRYGLEFAKYLRKPSCDENKNAKIKSFAATPLFYPIDSNYVVGVFEIATCSDDDFIYRWNQGTESEKKERHAMIGNLLNNQFLNFCEKIY